MGKLQTMGSCRAKLIANSPRRRRSPFFFLSLSEHPRPMLDHLNLIAKILVSVSVISVTVWQVWGFTVTIRDLVKSVKKNECKLSRLDETIIEKLDNIEAMGREAGKNADRRFDRIEKRLTYLFGKTNTTIPPND